LKAVENHRAELSICLQNGRFVQDVPPERMLKRFPTRLDPPGSRAAKDEYSDLGRYDVVIAFDPDWAKLTAEQGRLLEKWLGQKGHGLILVAGPINTPQLARPATAARLKVIRDLLPVRLADVPKGGPAGGDTPRALNFPAVEKFLKLEDGKDPLGGWSEFFFGKKRDDWQRTKDQPERGFFTAYPVKSVRKAATVIAAVRDPAARIAAPGGQRQDLPYLVAMPLGKGRSVYLGSGELWRLRMFREGFHERLWTQLIGYAAEPPRKPGPKKP
jgi:hypothetical protein